MDKKQAILKTSARLFAAQGFEATTTLQIAREAGATEPLIYYHFKGKDDLFTRIIGATFSEYFSRIDALEKSPDSPFGQIRKLIELHPAFPRRCRTGVQSVKGESGLFSRASIREKYSENVAPMMRVKRSSLPLK